MPNAFLRTWKNDLPSSIVVALVALPLCLGIALASGAPLFSGLISGIVGGIVVGIVGKSPLSVSGPAAGLTAIVLTAIESIPTYEAFLLCVCLAGLMQMIFSFSRAGVLSEFVPSSVITGMLAAIGIILILKQFPHAIGYDSDYQGDFGFFQPDGRNTLSGIIYALQNAILPGALLIAVASLIFLFWWDKAKPKDGPFKLLPGPLVVVVVAIFMNWLFGLVAPGLVIADTHLVRVPVAQSPSEFVGFLKFPDFGAIGLPVVWTSA
jgi:carbonic anhydrase